jgi:hypothetical protein
MGDENTKKRKIPSSSEEPLGILEIEIGKEV